MDEGKVYLLVEFGVPAHAAQEVMASVGAGLVRDQKPVQMSNADGTKILLYHLEVPAEKVASLRSNPAVRGVFANPEIKAFETDSEGSNDFAM